MLLFIFMPRDPRGEARDSIAQRGASGERHATASRKVMLATHKNCKVK
jgi:hypothetical protein